MSFDSRSDVVIWVEKNASGTRKSESDFNKVNRIQNNPELMAALAEAAKKRMKKGRPTVDPGSKGVAKKGRSTVDLASDNSAKISIKIAEIVGCSESKAKEHIAVSKHPEFVKQINEGKITPHSAYKAIRGHATREQKCDKIAQNMPKAHEAVELSRRAGTLIGKVHHCDVLVGLRKLADNSLSVIITSVPYPLTGVKYPNSQYDGDYKGYLRWMQEIFFECKRILLKGGKVIINFDNCNIPSGERTSIQVRHDLRRDFANIMAELGTIFVDEYIWAKQNAVGGKPCTGTKGNPSGHRVNNNSEYICVWAKDQVKKGPENTEFPEDELIDLMEDEQYKLSKQVWAISPGKRKDTGHRCAFPVELARRLILLYSYMQDTVCDPFSGSGTTCATAGKMGRKFVGFDNAIQYVEIANKNIEEALKNPFPPPEKKDWDIEKGITKAQNNEFFLAKNQLRESKPQKIKQPIPK